MFRCQACLNAGKTYVLNLTFLAHVAQYENEGLAFIIGGATQASIRRNILDDLEKILGKELKFDKSNAVEIFGNKIYCFDGANSDAWKKARGFTAAGALLNEATALHDTFIKEVLSRCSYTGARVYMDTNPENPAHTVKTDYIDNDGQRLDNGQLNIKVFNFNLFDNIFLDPEYVESIVASTPSGMFTDRDIHGLWVAAQGVVYKDFNKDIHYISKAEFEVIDEEGNKAINIVKHYCGVDWGFEHYGSIVLLAEDDKDNIYLIKEYSAQHQEIDYWVDIAKEIKKEYGNISFYCDTARPEYVKKFKKQGIKAINADKAVLAGIGEVASRYKSNKLFIIEDNVDLFKQEIYNYVWSNTKDEPVKKWDDVQDALRYGIYTEKNKNKWLV